MKQIKFILTSLFIYFFISINLASAGLLNSDTLVDMAVQGDSAQTEAGYENSTIGETVATVIKAFLSVLGLIFMVLLIYSGFLWMTAGGNAEQVQKAKDGIIRSIIGLIIIISAYSIMHFVFKYILK